MVGGVFDLELGMKSCFWVVGFCFWLYYYLKGMGCRVVYYFFEFEIFECEIE